MFSVQTGNLPWSPIHLCYGVFQPEPAGPSDKSVYTLSTFKDKGDLVQFAESLPRGFELTGLYAECPRTFGKKPSSSFARFVQALALHDNLVAQTFF